MKGLQNWNHCKCLYEQSSESSPVQYLVLVMFFNLLLSTWQWKKGETCMFLHIAVCHYFKGLHYIPLCIRAMWLQSCLTLFHPLDCSLLSSSIHGILQARILKWVAMPSSRGSSWPRDGTRVSFCVPLWQAGSLPLAPPAVGTNTYRMNTPLINISAMCVCYSKQCCDGHHWTLLARTWKIISS